MNSMKAIQLAGCALVMAGSAWWLMRTNARLVSAGNWYDRLKKPATTTFAIAKERPSTAGKPMASNTERRVAIGGAKADAGLTVVRTFGPLDEAGMRHVRKVLPLFANAASERLLKDEDISVVEAMAGIVDVLRWEACGTLLRRGDYFTIPQNGKRPPLAPGYDRLLLGGTRMGGRNVEVIFDIPLEEFKALASAVEDRRVARNIAVDEWAAEFNRLDDDRRLEALRTFRDSRRIVRDKKKLAKLPPEQRERIRSDYIMWRVALRRYEHGKHSNRLYLRQGKPEGRRTMR